MKLLAVVLSSLALSTAAHAQGMKGMDMKDTEVKMEKKAAKEAVHKAAGVVTEVDAGKGKVTIKHEPIQSLKWPAMNMVFTVKDKALLGKLAKDKKVDFEFKKVDKDYVITSVK